jgi:hypothetical protein
MTVARRCALAVAALLLVSASLRAAALTPGSLYGLAYDFSVNKEKVVRVDPASGLLTQVDSSGIDDCCLIGGFPVYALDANIGRFYAAGFRLSDGNNPDNTDFRLLGFDAVTGTLATDSVLTSGTYLNNLFKLDIGTGILWGLVYDLGAAEEAVVIVTPTSADRTQVGNTIADCCSIGGFNVSAFDPASGRLYVAGNLTSDPGTKRLLGFDALTGTLVSSPALPPTWQYNDFEMDPLTGTLYGIVFDFTNTEYVVTVNPATGAVTTVGEGGVPNCCTVSSGNAFDPYTGKLYIMGNLLTDPSGSLPRLLGFDVGSGMLASSPFLPTGWNYNVLQVAVTAAANHPPVAVCQDVEVAAATDQCGANASIDGGSHDDEGSPLLISQDPSGPYPTGDTEVTLFVYDGQDSDSCQATVTVTGGDNAPPILACNSPATITPPDAPTSFMATATSANCGGATAAAITGYDCWKVGDDGPHHAGCQVDIEGGMITIQHTGGVGTHIEWTVEAGGSALQCSVEVVNPGHN